MLGPLGLAAYCAGGNYSNSLVAITTKKVAMLLAGVSNDVLFKLMWGATACELYEVPIDEGDYFTVLSPFIVNAITITSRNHYVTRRA